jgi:probable F420-dependent oxidoreductase
MPAKLTGVGIYNTSLRFGDPAEIPDAASELEELGYTGLWIPDVGGPVFEAVELLLSATSAITVATGILNLWMHSPEETAAAHARLTDSYGDRIMIGIGVSHAERIDQDQPGRYTRPLEATRSYLDGLDAAPIPLAREHRSLAALGPKMLELAATRTAGVHPYNVTAEHTAIARAALGSSGLVMPEQTVALTNDADTARRLGRRYLTHYLTLPNYVNNWFRLGFDESDLDGGGSDRLIDALVAWGDESKIVGRVQDHFDAGANHVCIQVLTDAPGFPLTDWRALAPALTGSAPAA